MKAKLVSALITKKKRVLGKNLTYSRIYATLWVMTEPKQVVRYVSPNGKEPFTEWLSKLKDRTARARILIKIDRLAQGVTTNTKSVGDDVSELKMTFGPGYRVYFGHDGNALIVLLAGGDKSSQSRDIEKAKEYWNDYKK